MDSEEHQGPDLDPSGPILATHFGDSSLGCVQFWDLPGSESATLITVCRLLIAPLVTSKSKWSIVCTCRKQQTKKERKGVTCRLYLPQFMPSSPSPFLSCVCQAKW